MPDNDQPSTGTSGEAVEQHAGATVVFLHHFGGSSRTWTEVIQRLARVDPSIQCVVPDLHGFGLSASHGSPEENVAGYEIDDYADEVAGIIGMRGVEQYILVGHSMGGKIALALASRRPAGLAGLLLVAPSPPSAEPMSDHEREQLRRARGDAAVASQIVSTGTAKPPSKPIHDRTVADVLGSAPKAWNAWLDTGSRSDVSARVTGINVPVIVLAGGHDPAITPSLLKKEIIERISGSRLVLVPDSAHLMPLDSPAAISGHIRDFVRSLHLPKPASRPMRRTWYPAGTVRDLLSTDLVTEPTRRVLNERIANAPGKRGVFFKDGPYRTLSAVCARLIPQRTDSEMVDIAGEIDMRLARGEGNGWRYEDLPPDGEAYRMGLMGLDETAHDRSSVAFVVLDLDNQDSVLLAVQQNRVGGGTWDLISPSRFFEELLAEASEIYFSHPIAQERIGYAGMADNRGWQSITLNQLEPQEPLPLEPRNA